MFLSIPIVASSQDKWIIESEYLAGEIPVFVFRPAGYDSHKKYPVVYLLHGYSEDYTQWNRTIDCQYIANKYNMIHFTKPFIFDCGTEDALYQSSIE